MGLLATHGQIDATAIDQLSVRDADLARRAESEMAWDADLRVELLRLTPMLATGRPGPVTLLDPVDAPHVLHEAVEFWHDLPALVGEAIHDRWPAPSMADRRTRARLALLAWRCDADNERRASWVSDPPGKSDPYAIALLRDRCEWISSGRQLYGTMATWDQMGTRPVVPIADPGRLAARRDDLGMRPWDQDVRERVTTLALLRRLSGNAARDASPAALN